MGYLRPAPAAIIADLTPKEASGAVIGLYRMAGDIGLLLGPVAIGWAAGRVGFASAFAAGAGCIALVAIMGLGARETLRPHENPAQLAPALGEVSSQGPSGANDGT